MKLLCLFIAIAMTMPSQPKDPFGKFTGTWKREGKEMYEVWENGRNGSYRSYMYSLRNGDTTIQEKVETYRDGGAWVYAVTGAGNDTTVRFRSALVTDSSAVFTNPLHDFPQEIHYRLESPRRLRAFIVGGKDTVRFDFQKQ
jgi:Domain of unknown function (DUF6265)